MELNDRQIVELACKTLAEKKACLLYTSDAADD